MKNIILTGFMATGKSTVGRRVASIMNFGFIDTDSIIEKISGMNIPEIFEKRGEKYFRSIEKIAVKRASRLKNHVISTGGGVVLSPSNIVWLRRNGIIILLKARPEIILRNLGENKNRPLLFENNPEDKIKELLVNREKYYNFSDYKIDVSDMSIEEAVSAVIEVYRNYLKG